MNKLNTTLTGGWPIALDDLGVLQTSLKELAADIAVGMALDDINFRLYGCDITMNNDGGINPVLSITHGALYFNGEIYKVDDVNLPQPDGTLLATLLLTWGWDLLETTNTSVLFEDGFSKDIVTLSKAQFVETPVIWSDVRNLRSFMQLVAAKSIDSVISSTATKEVMKHYSWHNDNWLEYHYILPSPVVINPTSEYNNYYFNTIDYRSNTQVFRFRTTVDKITTSNIDYEFSVSKLANDGTPLGDWINSLWNVSVPYKINGVFQDKPAVITFYTETTTSITLKIKLFTTAVGSIDVYYNGYVGNL